MAKKIAKLTPQGNEDDIVPFKWEEAEKAGEVIVQPVAAVAVYFASKGKLIIRQEVAPQDHLIMLSLDEARNVANAILKAVAEEEKRIALKSQELNQ